MPDDMDPVSPAGPGGSPDDPASGASPEVTEPTGEPGPAAADVPPQEGSAGAAPGEGAAEERPPEDEVAVTETVYEATPSGHRVTRRTIRQSKKKTTKHVEETITEDVPLAAYQAPRSSHPMPVG